jgi:hypothetical protein
MNTDIDNPCSRRNFKIALGAVVLLLILGGQRIWLTTHREVIAKDGILYVQMAQRMAEAPLDATREMRALHPGYSAATAGVHGLVGGTDRKSWEDAATLVSFQANLAAVLGVWVLGWLVLGSPQLGWCAALLFGLGHNMAILGADVGSDSLALAFGIWSVVTAVRVADGLEQQRRGVWAWAVVTGLLVGAGYLVRPEMAVVLLAGVVLWLTALRRGARLRPVLGCALALLAGAAVLAVPYMVLVGSVLGKWGGESYWRLAAAAQPQPLAMIASASNPFEAVGKVVAEFFEAQHPVLATLTCLYLLAWALGRTKALQPWRDCLPRPSRSGGMMLVLLAAFSVPTLALREALTGELSSRYAMLLAATTAILPAALLGGAGKLAATLADMRQARARVFYGGLAALAVTLAAHALRPVHSGDVYLREAGLALGQVIEDDEQLLSDSTYVLYYSGGEGKYLPRDEAGQFRIRNRPTQPGEVPIIQKRSAAFVAMRGLAGSEQLQADAASMRGAGYSLWQEFARDPDDADGRVLRIWRRMESLGSPPQ